MHTEQVNRLIEQKLKQLGFTQYHSEPLILLVSEPTKKIVLGNDYLFLNTYILDVPVTTKLQLESPDNLLITSKIDYETFNSYKHQVFSEAFHITVENYGAVFTPFKLEFIKVTPLQ